MANTSGIYSERYTSHFAATLRSFMEHHPETGERTTQRQLADFLHVRPQTVSLYSIGESIPNCEQLLKIAEYFNVTADFLMTGRRTENVAAHELLGLSENTIQNIKLVKDGYFEDTPGMHTMLDRLLSDKDFYKAMEKAVHWNNEKIGAADDWQRFCEWNATNAMQDFFLNFFAMLAAERENGGAE